jgi:hypothetical protein
MREYVGLLGVFTLIGLGMKKFRFSRPALMIGFILGDKIELLGDQVLNLFNIGGYPLVKLTEFFGGDTIGQGRLNVALAEGKDLLGHPVFVVVFVLTLIVMIWGWKNKGKVDYA